MKKSLYSLIVCFAIAAIIFGSKIFFPQNNIIAADNFGYYLHLPAHFIYDDPGLKGDWINVINEKYKNTPTYYQLMQSEKGGIINRFYAGMAILWSPAFFVGHLVAGLTNQPTDGFSAPYQWALMLYGAIFAIIGLFYLRKVLLQFFSDGVTAVTLLILYIGTNFFFFTTIGNDVPHVYLFTLFAALIYYTIKWYESHKWLHILLLGLIAGLIIAVRPSEIIFLLIPALWGITSIKSIKERFNFLLKQKFQIAAAAAIVVLLFLPQLLYYRMYAGEYFVSVYNDAGSTLDLLNPRFAYVLFSFRKGWFIYSPLSILCIGGLVFAWKYQRVYFWPVLISLLLNLYLIASFTSLVSYGWRAFIQSYAILALPLGSLVFSLSNIKKIYKAIMIFLILPFIALNVHQAWQVRVGVIDGSRMTKDYYFKTIGKNQVSQEDRNLLMVERSFTTNDKVDESKSLLGSRIFELSFDDQIHENILTHQPRSGSGMYILSKVIPYSPGLKEPFSFFSDNYYFYMKTSVWVFGFHEDIPEKLHIVFSTKTTSGGDLKYRAYSFNALQQDFKPGQWNLLTADYLTPEVRTKDEFVQTYIWYNGEGEVWIDDFSIDILQEK
jgi:hypothetical protein